MSLYPWPEKTERVYFGGYEPCHTDETTPVDVVTTTIELSWPFVPLTCGSGQPTTSKKIPAYLKGD